MSEPTPLGNAAGFNFEYMRNSMKELETGPTTPNTGFDWGNMRELVAKQTAAQMAPQLDRPTVFGKIRATQEALIADAMTHVEQYKTPVYVPLITMAGASRPATPEEIAKGLVDSPRKPTPLAPEAKFKQDIADIYSSDKLPEEKEALIKRAGRGYAKTLFNTEKAPIQAYYDFRLSAARDAERHGVDLTDWIKNWKNAGGWGEPSNADIMQMLGEQPDTLASRAGEGLDAVARGVAMAEGGIGGMFGADEYARAAYLVQNAPELAPTLNPDWADKAISIVGETLPYMVATTAASLATGGLAGSAIFGAIGGGFISFGIEGNSAYQDAFAATGDEVLSRKIGLQVGLINAVVEAVPFGSGTKYIKGMWKKGLEKAVETKMMKAGKWTLERLKTAVEEGLEESGQELSTMRGESQYREVKGKEIVDRVLQAGAAGFLLGGAMSIALSPLSTEGADAEAKRVREQMGKSLVLKPLTTVSSEENLVAKAALTLIMQKEGVAGSDQIKILDRVELLADHVAKRNAAGETITPAGVREIIVEHGLDPDKHTAETIQVLGYRMNSGIVEIYQGGSVHTVFHELTHGYAKTLPAGKIAEIRAEYEQANPDTSGPKVGETGRRSDEEWLADISADNALRTRKFLGANKSLRSLLDFQDGLYANILARVYNLHKNVRAGRVSAQFQEMLEAPFKPANKYTFTEKEMAGPPAELMKVVRERQPQRTAPGRPGPNPEEQRQRNMEKKLVRQHNEYFEKYRKLPTPDLEKKIRKVIENHAKLLGLRRDQERSFIPAEAKDQTLVLSKELIEKAKLLKTPVYSLGVVPNPVGASVTAPRTRYSGEIAADGVGKNVWVRPAAAETYTADNSKRTLLVQFSTDILNAGEDTDTDSATLSRKLYSTKDGYHRPTSDGKVDFWEIPTWITEMAYTVPNSDVYVVRDMAEAKQFLQESGYKTLAFSALDVNAKFIKGLVQDFPGKVAVGGYVGPDVFTDTPNVKRYDSIESFVKDEGLTYKHGADYRHFQGSETVARLCLSKGCLHRCAFCSVSKDLGKRAVEEITPATIEQQIESFKDLYTPLVYLNDKTFGQSVSAPKLAEYGDQIKKNNPEFEGFVIQTTANQMRKFTPEYLAASHIKIVELGVESYNNEVLGPMRKPASEKTLQAATDQIRENGLELVPNIMVGLPGETAATYAKTLAFLEKNKDIISHVNIYNAAVYHGTKLAEVMGVKVAGDMSENALVKSWMKNPELHKKFSRDVHKFAGKQLETGRSLLDLRPLEQKLVRAHSSTPMSSKTPIGLLLSNGEVVAVSGKLIHEDYAQAAGTSLDALLREGVVRYRATEDVAVEARQTMTAAQQDGVAAMLTESPGRPVFFDYADPDGGFASRAYIEPDQEPSAVARDMQKRLKGEVPVMLDLAAVVDPASPATKEQAVQGNILSEILGMKEGEHKTYIASLTNKTGMDQLTYGEAAKVINAYTSEARKRGIKLAGVNRFADWLGVLIDTVSKVKDSDINGLRPSDLVETWRSFKKGANGYFLGGARIERLVWALGGYEQGSLYKALFLRVREASDRGDVASIARMEDIQGWLYGTFSKEQVDALLSKQQDQVLPDKYLDPAEQISFLLMAKNEHGLSHLTQGHNYSTLEVTQAIDWITTNRKDVVAVADWMAAKYEEQFARLDAEHFRTTGEHLLKEDFYSPLYLKNVELERQPDFMSDLLATVQAPSLENKPGELQDRSFNAGQPVRMDAFDNYGYNTRRVERYIAMAFAVNRTAKILNNRNFRTSLNRATSGYGDAIMRNWLTDTARGYAAEGQSFIDATARFLRRKSMVYVLGGKIVSALRQTLTLSKTMAIDPAMIPIVIRNLVTIPIFTPAYRKMSAEIFAESDMMKARSWDRIEAQLANSKTVRRGLRGKTTWDEKLLFLVKTMDRYTTLISYKSAKELAIGKGMAGKDVIRFADEAIRSTQSMGGAVDLPAFFRGGTLSKLLTTFENDSNQNFNYWKFDVFGQYSAGKIGMDTVAYRLLMSYILPALLMGAIGRGGTPDDLGDVAIDLATFPLSSFVLFGRWAYALGRGFDPGNTIMDVPFTEATKALAAAKRGDAGTAAWQGLKAAGAFSGTVPQQAFIAAQGVSALATDPTADLREILWTKSQLRGGRAAPKKKAAGGGGFGKWDKL